MGISRDGIFKKEDLHEQPKFVEGYFSNIDGGKVLELAAGKGASLKFLSQRNPKISFYGLDLPDGQFGVAKRKIGKLKNVNLVEGDYHNLSCFEDNKFDVIYIFEALCYSSRKDIVAKEAHRVLKKGGYFIVIDGYSSKKIDSLENTHRVCHNLASKGMMLNQYYYYEDVRDEISSQGFEVVFEENLSRFIIPTGERFEKLSSLALFDRPLIGKLLVKMFPTDFSYNAIFGYLMADLMREGVGKYMATVFQKRG
jgi:SAM-dependent methyltransferase